MKNQEVKTNLINPMTSTRPEMQIVRFSGQLAFLSVGLIFLLCGSLLLKGNGKDPGSTGSKVKEAYDLRMNGKAGQAAEMLQEILRQDSTDASAWFELARTRHHIFLGSGQYSPEEWKSVLQAAKQAARFDHGNKVYAYYYAYDCFFDAFISLMRQQPDAGPKITAACDAFRTVSDMDQGCKEAELYLVDIYGMLPPEMGGDKEKALQIAGKLNAQDKLYGALALARLMPDTTDLIAYWHKVGAENGMNGRILEELGRAYLLQSKTDEGSKYFNEAMQANGTHQLTWNLIRYHIMSTQQDPGAKAAHLEEATKLVNLCLETTPELTGPMKAYAFGTLALIRMLDGDNTGSNEYRDKAASNDPYYSRATGAPPDMLYCPPEKVKIEYSSFFLPF